MRWLLFNCVVLATAAHVLSRHPPKRDLSQIKNLISSKLLGTETIFVQLAEIPKNETFQLFEVKGYDDFFIKLTRIPEKKKVKIVKEKVRDPVIVTPEIAIVGNYLGTTTQGETLHAIEFIRNLQKLASFNGERDKLIQENMPITNQLPYKNCFNQETLKPLNVFTEKSDPNDVFPQVSEQAEKIKLTNPVSVFPAEYSPLVAASEVKYKPIRTKYSYEQKGENADMKFESDNNQDVTVTRLVKEPKLPEYIKLRFEDVASIGANPYIVKAQQPFAVIPEEHLVQPVNFEPGSYGFLNPLEMVQKNMLAAPISSYVINRNHLAAKPGFVVMKEPGYVITDNMNSQPIMSNRNPAIFPEPLAIPDSIKNSMSPIDSTDQVTKAEIDSMNQFINGKLHQSKKTMKVHVDNPKTLSVKLENYDHETKTSKKEPTKEENEVFFENSDLNDAIVTHYLYKQMNHHSHDNCTVVKVEDPSDSVKPANSPNTIYVVKSSNKIPDDFIFMTPENINIPPPNMIPKTDEIRYQTINNEKISNNNNPRKFVLNKEAMTENLGLSKTSDRHSLAKDPIVVLENSDQKYITYSGDESSFRPYIGGPVF